MPTYDYACDACGKSFEVEQRITEAPLKECRECGKPEARRMISGGNFLLKGSGWYADGYSGKSNGKSSSTPESSPNKDSSSSGDSSSSSGGSPSAPAE